MAEENKSTAPVKVSTNAVKKSEGKLPFGKRVAKWFREMRSEAQQGHMAGAEADREQHCCGAGHDDRVRCCALGI